jgi:hypothetical protein
MNIINKIKSVFTRRTISLDELLQTWSDDEVLENFLKFFSRVSLGTDFEQTDKIVTHEVLIMQCGDASVTSSPLPLAWPMRPVSVKLKKSMVN